MGGRTGTAGIRAHRGPSSAGDCPCIGRMPRPTDMSRAAARLQPHFAKALVSLLGSDHEELERAFVVESTAHWMAFADENDLLIEKVALELKVPAARIRPSTGSATTATRRDDSTPQTGDEAMILD